MADQVVPVKSINDDEDTHLWAVKIWATRTWGLVFHVPLSGMGSYKAPAQETRKKEGVPHRSQFDMEPRINMQHMWRRPSSNLLCDMVSYAYVRGMRPVTTPTVFHHPDWFCLAGHSLAFHSHLETTLSDRQMQR